MKYVTLVTLQLDYVFQFVEHGQTDGASQFWTEEYVCKCVSTLLANHLQSLHIRGCSANLSRHLWIDFVFVGHTIDGLEDKEGDDGYVAEKEGYEADQTE